MHHSIYGGWLMISYSHVIGGSNPRKGDLLVIAGATLYAISNVSEVSWLYFFFNAFCNTLAIGNALMQHSTINMYTHYWKYWLLYKGCAFLSSQCTFLLGECFIMCLLPNIKFLHSYIIWTCTVIPVLGSSSIPPPVSFAIVLHALVLTNTEKLFV